jgi:hypothetical protein
MLFTSGGLTGRGRYFVVVSLLFVCHSWVVGLRFVCWMVMVIFFSFLCMLFMLGCRSYWVYTLSDIATVVSLTRALGIRSK